MRYVSALILFFAILFNLSTLSAKEAFKLGYTEVKPFIWKEGSVVKGIYIDILEEALTKRMGIPVSYTKYPKKRLEISIKRAIVDGYIDIATPQNLQSCFTGRVPVTVGMVGAFTYKDHSQIEILADADTKEELKSYKIISFTGDAWVNSYQEGINIDFGAPDLQSALTKLKLKRGDIVLHIEQIARYNIQQLGFQDSLVQLPNIAINPIFYQLLINKKSSFSNILQNFDSVLTAMLNDGTIANIYNKYEKENHVTKVSSDKKPKIKFLHYATGIMPDVINNIASDFNNTQNQYRLKPIHMDMERYKQAIKVMLAGGLPADIVMTWAGFRTKYLVDLGAIEPIDDIWQSSKMDSQFHQATAAGMTYNGSKYAIPLSHHIVPFFYNKEIFTKYAIEPPKTWEEFLQVGEQLKTKGIVPIALGSKERWPAQFLFDYLLVRTAGAEYRQQLISGKASFSDPEVVKVFLMWKDLIDRGFFNKDCNSIDYNAATQLVVDGTAAMTLNGTWIAGDFKSNFNWEPQQDFDFFVFPTINPAIPDVVVGIYDVVLLTRKGNINGSKEALVYLADVESQMSISKNNGAIAPNTKVPPSFYPPMRQEISKAIASTPYEIYSFDLSTPPLFAEIGLDMFKEFLAHPEQYEEILKRTDQKINQLPSSH